MLGLVLRRIADSPEAERPTGALLADDLRAFIDHPDRRTIARAILPHMLTEADTKRPRMIGELCSATGSNAHLIHGFPKHPAETFLVDFKRVFEKS
jgi:hypothetical protein